MIETIAALFALSAMEIVLGIDNIVFIAILAAQLPKSQQATARTWGLALAMITRIALLLSISWIMGLTQPVLHLDSFGLNKEWLGEVSEHTWEEINNVSWKDIILFAGGLFLIFKSVQEIHEKVEGHHSSKQAKKAATFLGVITSIAIFDIIFSLDSVITAVGMARDIRVMVAAVVLAVIVMMTCSGPVSRFVEKHATVKILALSFLVLIGVMLVSEAMGTAINKGYIYFAMAFALIIEMLNLRLRPHSPTAEVS